MDAQHGAPGAGAAPAEAEEKKSKKKTKLEGKTVSFDVGKLIARTVNIPYTELEIDQKMTHGQVFLLRTCAWAVPWLTGAWQGMGRSVCSAWFHKRR